LVVKFKKGTKRNLKKKKVTYNPKGLKRKDNVTPPKNVPTKDINIDEIIIDTDTDHYWRIIKKEEEEKTMPNKG
jgi:hypothetical protein